MKFSKALLVLFVATASSASFAADVTANVGQIWLYPTGTFVFSKTDLSPWCSSPYGGYVRVAVGRSTITSLDVVKEYLSLINSAKLAGKSVTVWNVRYNAAGHCDFDAITMN